MLAGSRPQPHSATAVFDSQARLNVAAVRSAKYYLSPARQAAATGRADSSATRQLVTSGWVKLWAQPGSSRPTDP